MDTKHVQSILAASPHPYDLTFCQNWLQDRISRYQASRSLNLEYSLLKKIKKLRESSSNQQSLQRKQILEELNPVELREARAQDLMKDYKGESPDEFKRYLIEGKPIKKQKQSEFIISAPPLIHKQSSSFRKRDYLSKKKQQIDDSLALLRELRQRDKNKQINEERVKADRASAEQDLLEGAKNLKMHAAGIRDHLRDDEGKVTQLKQDQEKSKLSLDKQNSRLKQFTKSKGIGLFERILTFLCALVVFFLGLNLIFWFPMRQRGS